MYYVYIDEEIFSDLSFRKETRKRGNAKEQNVTINAISDFPVLGINYYK